MRFLLVLWLCLLPLAAAASEAISGDAFRMEDGRTVRLLGLMAAGADAQSHLQALIGQGALTLENASTDRYGRAAADVYVSPEKGKKIWLQGDMLDHGLAFVYPPTGAEPRLADLLKTERAARQAKRGIWNDPAFADLPASEERKIPYGKFAFVSGKVVKAERIKNMVYLNFSAEWRSDFTIAIAAHDLKLFRKANLDPLDYEGKTVRVRGWVKRNFGPMITITHPAQIERLGEAPAKP